MTHIGAGDLRERVQVLQLVYDEAANKWTWEHVRSIWVKAEQSDRSNLFSAVGVGARSVTFTMRESKRLDLTYAFRWKGQFCFLTSITSADQRGFSEVKAALCSPVDCLADANKDPTGVYFPGVLTEKYVGHSQPDFHSELTTDYVLVTPKAVSLNPGSWLVADGQYYLVLTPHLLDPYKNEFEIQRKDDF